MGHIPASIPASPAVASPLAEALRQGMTQAVHEAIRTYLEAGRPVPIKVDGRLAMVGPDGPLGPALVARVSDQ